MASVKTSLVLQDRVTGTLKNINKALMVTLKLMKKMNTGVDLSQARMNLSKMATNYEKVQNAQNKVVNSTERVSRSLKKEATAWEKVKNSLVTRFALGNIVANLAMNVVYGFGNMIKSAIMYASSLVEVQNIVDVAYGKNSGAVDAWAKTTLKAYGLNEMNAKNYAGTLASQIQSSGIAQKKAGEMAMSLTGLAGDLASFYNIPIDVAFSKLRSGMAGMVIPLRKIGIDISVATMQEYMHTLGIKKKWKEMSQAEKVALRYNYVMKRTGVIQGDFVKTQDTFANQLRLVQQQWLEFTGKMAEAFLPVLNKCLIGVNRLLDHLIHLKSTLHPLIPLFTGIGVVILFLATHAIVGLALAIWKPIWAVLKCIQSFTLLRIAIQQTTMTGAGALGLVAFAVMGVVLALHAFGISYTNIFAGFIGVLYSVKQIIIETLISPIQMFIDIFNVGLHKLNSAKLRAQTATGTKKQKEATELWIKNDADRVYKENTMKGRIGEQYHQGLDAGRALAKSLQLQTHFGNNGKGFGDNGSKAPGSSKSNPLYAKLSDSDINALVEVAKINYVNKFVKMAPTLNANFGDVHETADTDKIMNHLGSLLEDAQNSALG